MWKSALIIVSPVSIYNIPLLSFSRVVNLIEMQLIFRAVVDQVGFEAMIPCPAFRKSREHQRQVKGFEEQGFRDIW